MTNSDTPTSPRVLTPPALTFLATVHQRNALTKGRIQHGFTLFDFHFDAERLETNGMNFLSLHGISLGLRSMFLMRIEDARLSRSGSRLGGSRYSSVS